MALAIARLAAENFRVTLDVTINETIIHTLSFIFLNELQLTTFLSKATALPPIIIKYSKRILCPRALGEQADQ